MKRLLISIASMALCGAALAASGPGALSWTRPTTNIDGSALAANQIDGYNIQCTWTPNGGGTATSCTIDKNGFAGSDVTGSLTLTYPVAGGKAEFQIQTRRTDGFLSPWSSITTQATKTFAGVGPSTPSDLKVVSIKLDVNISLDSGDGFTRSAAFTINADGPGVLAGFVKVATPCTGEKLWSYKGQNFYRFLLAHPRTGASNVAWYGSAPAKPENTAAPCA